MRRFLLSCAVAALATAAFAQDTNEDDRDWITGLIEDAVSNDDMTVRLSGFEGALSSAATATSISIADPEGVWLRLEGLVFDWNRSALLRGRVEIEQLSAERIELVRLPVATEDELDVPTAEATPFTLPDIPVAVLIEDISADEIILTEDLLGEPVTAQFSGSLTLNDGAGEADIELERTDEKTGVFTVEASYENASRDLAIALLAQEGQDGIAARMIGLPDNPAVQLEVTGDAPLDDFKAQIALATDDVDRISGTARLFRPEDTQDQAFDLDLSGDLRPLLDDTYDAFFGAETTLVVEGTAPFEGGLILSNLDIAAEQLELSGTATLDAQNWPESIDVSGRLAAADGSRVILPISGAQTEVGGMSLSVQYDATQSDDWTGAFDITGLARDGIAIDGLALSGGGIIIPGAGEDTRGRFSADMTYAARGLVLDDATLSETIGSDIEGRINLGRLENEPFVLEQLTLVGAGIDAMVRAYIEGPDERFDTRGELRVTADDLSRFAALAGMDLAGSGAIEVNGTALPFDGIFDITADATTNDLEVGIEQADALLTGEAEVSATVARDTEGTRIEAFTIASENVSADGTGTITSDGVDASFTAALTELGLVTPELSGPADIRADVSTAQDGTITLDATATLADARLDATGTATPIEDGYDLDTDSVLVARDLSTYAGLVGQDLSGAATVSFDGTYRTTTGAVNADIAVVGDDLQVGIEQVDPLLKGATELTASVEHDASETRVSAFDIDGDAISASGQGSYSSEGATARLVARVADIGLVAPQVSGPATVTADVQTDADGVITLDTSLTAPQANADFDGTATPQDGGYSVVTSGTASVNDLSAYRALIGQPVSGGLSVDLEGTYETPTGALDADVSIATRDVGIGNSVADSILAGLGRINANVGLSEAGRLRLDALDVAFPNLTANGNIATSGNDTVANLSVRLRDLGLFVADFSGPVTADINAVQDAAGWQVSGNATGPVNTAAQVQGRVGNDGDLSLDVTGNARLALANLYIAPRQLNGEALFDLTVNGPAELSSVSGPITIRNARLTAPTFQQALEDLNGTLRLTGSSVQIDLRGSSASGGDLTLSGPVGLSAPYTAALRAELDDIVVQDPDLYRALANGAITVNGALTGGAAIAGTIDLSDVEVQVPSTGVSALGSLPDVTHLGARSEVIQTLTRAGVGETEDDTQSSASSSSVGYPIDVTIRAPSQIFVRGRGLDAELGGSLEITGTTNNIIPIGRFDLVRGRLSILGQRFDLDEGYAQLQGDFSPYLRLVATTEASTGTEISIIVEGTSDDIDVTFESSPTLPQDEVLAQLLFGRDLSSISPLQAVQLASAVATLAGNGNGGVINSFREDLDLDDLDIITDDDGNAAVRAGKYVSENVYTEVTAGSSDNSEISINIDIDRNFTARGTVASDGETSVGIFFERDY